jgi:uncharacterized DUF497 family protein
MKPINWNAFKNHQLIEQRGISFDEVVFYIQQGSLLDDIKHPNSNRYPNQRVFVVDIKGYVFLVPYIENQDEIFLKTVIPSRKATKRYLGETK